MVVWLFMLTDVAIISVIRPNAALLVVLLPVCTPLPDLRLIRYANKIVISGINPNATLLVVVLLVCTPLSNVSLVLDTD